MVTLIRGNRVLLPNGEPVPATLVCRGGRIEEISGRLVSGADYDAGDCLIVPGMVDLHGDAFERQIHPRPRVTMPAAAGLLETDRQMIANGITTAFHGVTVTWEPGARDIHSARAILAALDRVRPRLRCDTRVHVRHEALSLDTVEEVCEWMRAGRVSLFAFNDHREMIRRALDRGALRDTVSIPDGEYALLAGCMFDRAGEVPASLERLAATAREMDVPLASHDDDTPGVRTSYRDLGCKICEFPADAATAECARAAGDEIILGAPNILRGGSHCGRAGAREMIRQGLCTILCSDYYYPALLIAPFLLAFERITSFGEAWELVSRAPARAAGLTDRGTLAPGMRADMLFIDDEDLVSPEVSVAFVEGAPVFTRGLLVPDGSSVIDT